MTASRRRLCAHLVASAAIIVPGLLGPVEGAWPGAFALREQSAQGLGLSFAGAAAGGAGLASSIWNPAALTGFSGLNVAASLSAIMPRADVRVRPDSPTARLGSAGDIALNGLIGSAAAAVQLNDRIWMGVATGAPYGMATKAPYDWSGQVYGRTSRVMGLAVTPQIAVKVTDWLSLGAGVTAQYLNVRLTQAAGVRPGAPGVTLAANAWGVGFTLGALITPAPGTSIGVGFRSAVRHDLEGEASGPLLPGGRAATLPAAARMFTPETVSLGVRQKLAEQWTALAGFEWTHWSRLGHVPVRINGVVSKDLAFEYRDGYMVSGGVEYAWSPALTLRGGVGYEWSPVTTRVRDVRLPDGDRVSVSVGLGWRINDALNLDLAYAHLFSRKASIRIAPGHPQYAGLVWSGSSRGHADIVSVGLNWRFGGAGGPF